MKTKRIANYTYEGLGFPIDLHHVEMVMVDCEWHPKIDVKKIADAAIKLLASQKERLTGDQIKFIRIYFSMTLREFATKVVHESHTAVNKWEKFGAKVTNMDINIEKMLRLYIHHKVPAKLSTQNFHKKYLEVEKLSASDKRPSCVQIELAAHL